MCAISYSFSPSLSPATAAETSSKRALTILHWALLQVHATFFLLLPSMWWHGTASERPWHSGIHNLKCVWRGYLRDRWTTGTEAPSEGLVWRMLCGSVELSKNLLSYPSLFHSTCSSLLLPEITSQVNDFTEAFVLDSAWGNPHGSF